MKIQQFNIEDEKKKNSFRVPEGYMEGLTDRIMARLPECPQQKETKVVSMAEKMRPWLYLAASFIGLLLIFKGIQGERVQKDHTADPLLVKMEAPEASLNAISEEDQEFLEYLEAQYADELFLEEVEAME
ncbi:hypothetical protein [Tannerella forsythia]|uniref:Uncharacterized protein n=1 Tax=Tannerella forsythia TaxID=28112 RepID=A0A1D3UM67_TANFO|nr:hypothetical protein [Tannerella forsythia]OLQ20172.1 hypothetical protein BGK60_03160 [Tannerella forsythia]BAR48902.1 hypothetical protein TF3313_1377 [Tannerella forsythia 3313]SCQ21148.1 hypothetical protein TFUB20_01282 [Tannerella forsythia]SCQ21874.1 hypothetical protein TFUB22_01244 [Tannerella forsythia]